MGTLRDGEVESARRQPALWGAAAPRAGTENASEPAVAGLCAKRLTDGQSHCDATAAAMSAAKRWQSRNFRVSSSGSWRFRLIVTPC